MVPSPVNLTPIEVRGRWHMPDWSRMWGFTVAVGLALIAPGCIAAGVWQPSGPTPAQRIAIRSIDTAKYSRDLAGQMLSDPSFDQIIYAQVSAIANTQANYVAIDTPYDEEFVPFLKRWVQAARINHLHVWFRGNFAGWEGWFNYPRIERQAHLEKIEPFIQRNPGLFEDGDIFSPCPECENGGPGDPRLNGDVAGFRQFMILEDKVSQEAFDHIGKHVASNYNSMNYDVARLVMDRETTAAMQGVVVIDHYVSRPDELPAAIDSLAASSGGKVILGEFGAPIPDINGDMTKVEQAAWLRGALDAITADPNVAGANYWTSFGGSTGLWDDAGNPRDASSVIAADYRRLQASPGRTLVDQATQALQDLHISFRHTLQAN